MSTRPLCAILVASVALEGEADALENELEASVSAGRAGWPDLAVESSDFVRHLATHVHRGRLPPVDHAAEMWLACACTHGALGAAEAFEQTYREPIERAVARIDRRLTDEGTQIVLTSLLVRSDDEPPRVSRYGGRSALETWLATVAARATLKLGRRKGDQRHASVSALVDVAGADDPDLALVRARYAPELALALGAAVTGLPARQRVLLRLHYADRWSLERLAALYDVSRATMARWLAAARGELSEKTKGLLRERLHATSSEVESLAAFLGADLEVSLARLLESSGESSSTRVGLGS